MRSCTPMSNLLLVLLQELSSVAACLSARFSCKATPQQKWPSARLPCSLDFKPIKTIKSRKRNAAVGGLLSWRIPAPARDSAARQTFQGANWITPQQPATAMKFDCAVTITRASYWQKTTCAQPRATLPFPGRRLGCPQHYRRPDLAKSGESGCAWNQSVKCLCQPRRFKARSCLLVSCPGERLPGMRYPSINTNLLDEYPPYWCLLTSDSS